MKNKHAGLLILGIVLVFFFVVFSFNNALENIAEMTCGHGDACPMQITLRNQEIISYSLMGLLLVIGLFITFFMKEELKPIKKEAKMTEAEINQKLEHLEEEEKNLMRIVLREEGSVYQSDLIKETGLSKVRITRTLDKLEGKALIERKRRGMTNIIILK